MVVFLIFLFTDLFIMVIFMAVYGHRRTYSEGMLLGVHIPSYAVQDEEVEAVMEKHRRRTKWFYGINLILSAAVCLLNFWYLSIFILVWSIWLMELTAGAMVLINAAHRHLYDIKVKRGWHGASGSRIVVVDTNVSAENDRLPFPVRWHIPVFAAAAALALIPGVREVLAKAPEMWGLTGGSAALILFFTGMHLWTVRRSNEVYSSNTEINLRVNRLVKRVWSGIWIISDYLNLLSIGTVIYSGVRQHIFTAGSIIGYIVIQCITGISILAAFLYLRWKKKDILKEDPQPLYVDDDIYWKNGWYNNPNDTRVWVPDRFCTSNYSTNMGRTAGKVFTFSILGFVLATFIVIFIVFLKMDFTPRYLSVNGEDVSISSPMAPVSFKRDEIQSIELLDHMPEGDFTRTNGLADERQLVGKFRERKDGEFRVYIYRGYSPILKIELPEYTVLINSEQKGETQNWYRELVNGI